MDKEDQTKEEIEKELRRCLEDLYSRDNKYNPEEKFRRWKAALIKSLQYIEREREK